MTEGRGRDTDISLLFIIVTMLTLVFLTALEREVPLWELRVLMHVGK